MMKIAFVASKGGHLGQIKIIFTNEVIGKNEAILVTESSERDLRAKEGYFNGKYRTYFFRKDYLGLNPFRYLSAILQLRTLFMKEKIDIVVTNGAQISIPAVIAARLLRIKSIFIDTIVRVKSPNWSARACYMFSNKFVVQHRNMIKKYGNKSEYWGSII